MGEGKSFNVSDAVFWVQSNLAEALATVNASYFH